MTKLERDMLETLCSLQDFLAERFTDLVKDGDIDAAAMYPPRIYALSWCIAELNKDDRTRGGDLYPSAAVEILADMLYHAEHFDSEYTKEDAAAIRIMIPIIEKKGC